MGLTWIRMSSSNRSDTTARKVPLGIDFSRFRRVGWLLPPWDLYQVKRSSILTLSLKPNIWFEMIRFRLLCLDPDDWGIGAQVDSNTRIPFGGFIPFVFFPLNPLILRLFIPLSSRYPRRWIPHAEQARFYRLFRVLAILFQLRS